MTEPGYKIFYKLWYLFLFFFLVIVIGSFQDVFNFVMPRGSGMWSIDPDIDLDGWHLFKQFKLIIIWAGMFLGRGLNKWQLVTSLCVCELYTFFIHEWILHQLF